MKANLLFILLLIPLVYSLEECEPIEIIKNIPCKISTTFQPIPPCANYVASIFTENGTFANETNLIQNGNTGFCFFEFNLTQPQTYYGNMTTGDTFTLYLKKEDNMLAIIIFQIFVITFFIAIGIPHKVGFAKIFSWSLAIIEFIMTVWMVYIMEIGGEINVLLFINAVIVLILGGFFGFITLFAILPKLADSENNQIKEDEYTKWM